MHLILTGATGLIGSGVLDAMLKMKDITKISILSRRPVSMAEQAKDPRVNVIIHTDFSHYGVDVLSQLQGASGAVWALGISQTKVSKDEYVKITKDYALAGAEAFSDLAPGHEPFRFIFVSGQGSTQNPGRFASRFSRVKGETEVLLSEMRTIHPRLLTEAVGPGYVDPRDHAAIHAYVPDQGVLYNSVRTVLGLPIRVAIESLHSPTEPLGKFLTEMAMGKYDRQLDEGASDIVTINGGLRIVKNPAFRRLAGL
ncbi:Fc.00g051370.m01.CDS01 [Cosmosporella sp. VM-42]